MGRYRLGRHAHKYSPWIEDGGMYSTSLLVRKQLTASVSNFCLFGQSCFDEEDGEDGEGVERGESR